MPVRGFEGDAPRRADAFPVEAGTWAPMAAADLKQGDVILPGDGSYEPVWVNRIAPVKGSDDLGVWVKASKKSPGGREVLAPGDVVRVHRDSAKEADGGRKAPTEQDMSNYRGAAKVQEEHDTALDLPKVQLDEYGYAKPDGDPAELPVVREPYQGRTLSRALARRGDDGEFPVVSGVLEDGTPFLGHFQPVEGDVQGAVEFVTADGEVIDLPVDKIKSARLVRGGAVVPGPKKFTTAQLAPGAEVFENASFAHDQIDYGRPGTIKAIYPDGRVEFAPFGRESNTEKGRPNRAFFPATFYTADEPAQAAPSVDAPEPESAVDAPDVVDTPRVSDVPEAADVPDPDGSVVDAPDARSTPDGDTADRGAGDREQVTDPARGEVEDPKPQEWSGRGASTSPKNPEAPESDPVQEPAPVPDAAAKEPAVVRPMPEVDDLPTAQDRITGRMPDWVTPDALQIGDFAWIDGMDEKGDPLRKSGHLANDPQPTEFQPSDGSARSDVLGILLSEEMDGVGEQTMVWAPLDRLAALAPRPEADEVVADGEQMAQNKLDVAAGRMPNRIPADSKGKLGLFPRSLVTDVDGQREGIVIASRGRDVSVRWAGGDVEDVAGQSLTVADGGIQRPDGWSRAGRRIDSTRELNAPDPAKQDPIKVDDAVQEELLQVVRDDTGDLVAKLGQAMDGSKPMSKAEFEKTLQGVLRKHMQESQGRRVQAARRMAAQRPYKPGLVAQLSILIGELLLLAGLAVAATLRWLFSENTRQWTKEHGAKAARIVARRIKNSNELRRLHRALGVTDDTETGGVDELVDAMGGPR